MKKLIDMAAQVSQSENAGHLTSVFGSNWDVFIAADSTFMRKFKFCRKQKRHSPSKEFNFTHWLL